MGNALKGAIAIGVVFGAVVGLLASDVFLVDLRPGEWRGYHQMLHDGAPHVDRVATTNGTATWKRAPTWMIPVDIAWEVHPGRPFSSVAGRTAVVSSAEGVHLNGTPGGLANAIADLVTLPVRMKDAPLQEWVGRKTWRGARHDVVFVAFDDTFEADRSVDHALVWINDANRVVRVDRTLRGIWSGASVRVDYGYPPIAEKVQTPAWLQVTDTTWFDKPMLTVTAEPAVRTP